MPHRFLELQTKLNYQFKQMDHLELACIHKSFGNEKRAASKIDSRNNERMEFLGDAILDLIVSRILVDRYSASSEGELSRLRAGLVNERTLAQMARELSLGDFLLLGKGEEMTGGREKDSILSSALEAIVAAIFLDGGYNCADAWVAKLFSSKIEASQSVDQLQDHKTRLQELFQARYKFAPRYEVISTSGPDHDKVFTVSLIAQGKALVQAQGKSKKEAEQNAAAQLMQKVQGDLTAMDRLLKE